MWVAVDTVRLDPDHPVPLVVYQAPSLSRSVSVQALEGVGRRSRITCTVRGVNGVMAGVRAGLSIAVMAQPDPARSAGAPTASGLPKLPHLDLVLLTSRQAPPEAAKALTSAALPAVLGWSQWQARPPSLIADRKGRSPACDGCR